MLHQPRAATALPITAVVMLACAALAAEGTLRPASARQVRRPVAEITRTPEEAAGWFLRSVRAIRWEAVAGLLADEPLARFHDLVTMMAAADTTGEVRTFLTGASAEDYAALGAADVFARALGAVIDDMPGLMHAVYDRDDEVLGHVPEGPDLAHVVYRTTARLSGAVPEVKVMQLRRTGAGWRVLWSDELEVLDAALRGFMRSRVPPPGS